MVIHIITIVNHGVYTTSLGPWGPGLYRKTSMTFTVGDGPRNTVGACCDSCGFLYRISSDFPLASDACAGETVGQNQYIMIHGIFW